MLDIPMEFIHFLFIAFLTVTVNIYFLLFMFAVAVLVSAGKWGRIKNEYYKITNKVELAKKFAEKHKFAVGFLAGISLVLAISIAGSPFIAIGMPSLGTVAPTGTIVFDRWQMNRVDRIEITRANGEVYLLNDRQITNFVRATMVARRVAVGGDLYVEAVNNIRLYRGSVLVREMASGKHYIRVYMPSTTHRFFLSQLREPFNRSYESGGFVSVNGREFDEFRHLGLV